MNFARNGYGPSVHADLLVRSPIRLSSAWLPQVYGILSFTAP